MKKVVLLIVFFAISVYAVNTTRYWDACKPSCGWDGNASGSPNGVAKSCNVRGEVLSNNADRNACESGGTAYTCMKQAPWKVNDNLSYGFAASHTNGDCGKCFELSFNNGKKMVIMVSNIGGDVANGQFDLMIPGGGVGAFNALSNQISQNGGSSSNLGQQYGGFRATCGPDKNCIRNMCNSAFGSAALADLKAGCEWYIDWFDAADNPTANSQSVTCPQALIDKYKGNFSNTNPTPTPSSSSSNNSGGGTSSNSSGGGSSCGSVVTASSETTKIEAECYLSKNGANMRTESANGVTSIGYIENGYSTTYKVSIPSGRAGQYTMRFRIATEVQSNFTVKVNNNNVGRIDQGSTGNWNTYIDKDLTNKAQFNNGENTIVLEFGSAVNVDYFLIIGGPLPSSSSTASSSSSAPRSSSSLSSSSSSVDPVPILQIPNTMTLESLANNTKIEIYSLQGKRIYSGYSENSKILKIPVQTKGMYIVKIKSGSEIKLLRVPVM
ncbi:MAG: T9SS type A sorting domain-containing protein [Fibromonadaceae bacterium]|jgi:hypothetical protein|nr:T9SS type A sorting domain-containing protein [Fibromonadaceae bacterium]